MLVEGGRSAAEMFPNPLMHCELGAADISCLAYDSYPQQIQLRNFTVVINRYFYDRYFW